MSFCFDHPDDAASWQGNRGKVRSMQEMLSDVDATLRLVEKAIEPEAIESETVAPETVAPETVGQPLPNVNIQLKSETNSS